MATVSLTELRALIRRHAERAPARLRKLPNVILTIDEAPTPPCHLIAEPMFSLVAQGAKRVEVHKRSYDYRAGQCLVVSIDLPVEAYVVEATPRAPYMGCSVALRPEVIASLLLEARMSPPPGAPPPSIAITSVTAELVDAVTRLLRLLDHPADIPILAPAIEREILWRLLQGPQAPMVRQIGLADSRLSRIGRAVGWLRANFAEAVRIEELAAVAGMSTTSLHRHFRDVTSMTPIQYQKQLRLQTARARLLSTRDDVAEVGFAVGYESASQFSREYRRMFGTPPVKDSSAFRLQTRSRQPRARARPRAR